MPASSSDIRSRRRRRLALIFTVVLLLVVGAGGLFAFSLHRQRNLLETRRDEGLKAHLEERHTDAVTLLEPYLKEREDDKNAWHIYGLSRLESARDANDVRVGLKALQDARTTGAEGDKVLRHLLRYSFERGVWPTAQTVADDVLRKHPNDAEALRVKAMTRAQDDPKVAVEAAEASLEQQPLDVRLWRVKHQLQVTQLGVAVDEVITQAQALVERHPEDARPEMVLAHANALGKRREPMVQALQSAAKKEVADAETALSLARLFEGLNLGTEALEVLREAADKLKAVAVREELARRLFENGRPAEAVAELASMEKSGDLSPALLGLRVITQFELAEVESRKAEPDPAAAEAARARGREALERLASIELPEAKDWARVLRAVYVDDITEPGKLANTIRDATAINHDPYLQFLMGMGYMRADEREAAKKAWTAAAVQRPLWSAPRVKLAQLALIANRHDEALAHARVAYRLRRDDIDVIVTLLQAQAAALSPDADELREELLANVEELNTVMPGDPRVLPLRIRLLAQSGRHDQAQAAIRQVLQAEGEPGRQLLTNLANLSRAYGLGLEGEIGARSAAAYGMTPELALGQAVDFARQGDAEAGLALLDQQVAAAEREDRVTWELVRAQFLEATDAGNAREAWAALAKQYPDQLRVQQAVMAAGSVRADRELMDRVIDRVRDLSGPDAVEWKVERARWLLTGPQGTERSAQERALAMADAVRAASPGRTEAVLLAATARARLGQSAAAVQLLEEASAQMPNEPSIAMDLARMYQAGRQYARASERLGNVLTNASATREQKLLAARMLAGQGESAAAAGALEAQRRRSDAVDVERDLVLAQLQASSGRLDRARELMEAVAAAEPSAESLLLLANLRLAEGDEAGADAVARRLAELDEAAVVRHVMLADYYRNRGDAARVEEELRKALDEQPEDTVLWKQLVRLHLQQADADKALATAQRALDDTGEEAGLRALIANADAVRHAMTQPPLRPLTEVVLTDDANRDTATEALTLIHRSAVSGRPTGDVLTDLRTLARDHPEVLGLLALSARADLSYGIVDKAIETAELARDRYPGAAVPLELLSLAYAARGDWANALASAQAWRERLGAAPLPADLVIARGRLETNDARGALDTLRPYRDRATGRPEAEPELTALYLRALAATGQTRQVEAVVQPLVQDKPLWRMITMELAATSATDPATARRWLELAQQHATPEEQFNLALAWYRTGQRLDQPAMYDQAARRLEAITAREDASVDAWFYRGVVADAAGDTAVAKASYERALEMFPKLTGAKNNLAMLLAEEPATQARALTLAREAVEESGRAAQYLDTLAHVQARMGKVDEAVATMREVVRAQPDVTRWQLNLANLLEQAGQEQEAQDIRSRYGEIASAER